jgi:Holliday junction resolvase RusA-like endonuclease
VNRYPGHFLVTSNGSMRWLWDASPEGLEFTATGQPVGQGRISVFRGHGVHTNAKRLRPWRETIRDAAQRELASAGPDRAAALLAGPVVVNRYYTLPYSPTAAKQNRLHPTVTSSTNPDIDHLDRALFDALAPKDKQAWRVLRDDAQIVGGDSWKTYPAGTPAAHPRALPQPGVYVQIYPIT